MTKIDIISGFLGAGKTTLIKKLIAEAYINEKVVLIENEFGEIGIDGGFMKDSGIEITEMNSGCICCSLVGDFADALKKVINEYHPDRIIIEPSGVGKLSDVVRAVSGVATNDVCTNVRAVVADASKCKVYMKNFGEFYNNQIENASAIILSRTASTSQEKLDNVIELIRSHNKDAVIITTPWDKLDGTKILDSMENGNRFIKDAIAEEVESDHHHNCECGYEQHHHHDDGECGCGHHHHHNDNKCSCGHNHEDECGCGHHHSHDADEIFTSWGCSTAKKFTKEQISEILNSFTESNDYGMILRAKGIIECQCGSWIHFDYVPGESDIRVGEPDVTGKICVIGSNLNDDMISDLFGVTKYERD